MKIVLFTDTIGDLNGVSRFLQDMAECALAKGDQLLLISSTNKYCPPIGNIHNFKPRYSIPMPFYKELELAFPPAAKMEEFVKSINPDLIHISTPGPVGLTGRKIAKKLGIAMFGTYHTDFPAYIRDNTKLEVLKRLTDKWMERFYTPFSHVFSRSDFYKQVMEDDIGIHGDKISIIRAGTNLERFSNSHLNGSVWEKFGVKQNSLKALYVGRISKEKNVDFLLDVWALFKEQNPTLEVSLVMIGEGRYKERARKMKDSGVHYLGPIIGDDLSVIYASSDFFLFPSITDTLGQVVMESSASALPIVVSDIGGPKSLLNPRMQSGYSLRTKKEQWVEHIKLLSEDVAHRKTLGSSAKEYMQSFPIENSYEDFIGVHKSFFEQNR